MKVYMIFIQDEWDNNIYLGLYKNLETAIPDINNELKTWNMHIDELQEYPSTFGYCFDTVVYDAKEETSVMIRGFILDTDMLKDIK